MRDEAPIYYDEDEDFYALTRHEDVAAAFKDHEAFSSAPRLRPRRWCAPASVRRRSRSSSWIRPTTATMRSLLNKAFTPRAIQAQKETVTELIEHYLGRRGSRQIRRRAGLLRPVPGRGDHHRMAGVPERLPPAGPALDRQGSLTASRVRSSSANGQHGRPTSTRDVLLRPRAGAEGRTRRTT